MYPTPLSGPEDACDGQLTELDSTLRKYGGGRLVGGIQEDSMGDPSDLWDEARSVAQTAGEVDFPDFVADSIKGVFDANVHTSIDQMKAYGALVKEASGRVGDFVQDVDLDHNRDPDPDDEP